MNRITLIADYLKRPGAEDEVLRAVRPRLYLSDDSLMDFGTPGAAEERRQIRRLRWYRFCFWAGMVVVVLAIGFAVGYNVHVHLAPR